MKSSDDEYTRQKQGKCCYYKFHNKIKAKWSMAYIFIRKNYRFIVDKIIVARNFKIATK